MRNGRATLAFVAIVAIACGGTAGSWAETTRTTKPGVETYEEHFVDATRPTQATAAAPGSDTRVLDTTIAYPTDTHRKMPLIVLAHGNDGHPRKFKILISAWAEAGYVVAAPTFPLTNDEAPGPSVIGDFVNQPADLSFVIDQVLKRAKKKSDSPIAGLVDKKRIGVAGLSLGGGTAYGLVFNSCCLDKRVDAVIAMAALHLLFEGGTEKFRSIPIMLVHGDADSLFRISQDVYPQLKAPKFFVTLHGSTHSAPFEDSPDPADEVVPVITTDFFDLYLKGEKKAAKRLVAAVTDYGQADLEREL